MNTNSLQQVGQKLLLAFRGKEATPEIVESIKKYRPAGLTLFRNLNIDNPSQLLSLTASLQAVAEQIGLPPLLIAIDQETGQLMSGGEGITALPGNMALGATGSPDLALRAGEILGRELASMGVNVVFAPCCDVNINPRNPVIGTRSFGEKSDGVAVMAAAMISGIQSQGVAATAKHFPGHGDTVADSHHGMPSARHELDRLHEVEFPPFQAALKAEVKLIMSAHFALPAMDGPEAPPASMSVTIIRGILREKMGYTGVVVSDAMDVQGIRQGGLLGEDAVRAASADVDLLLLSPNPIEHRSVFESLSASLKKGTLDSKIFSGSVERIASLKTWLREQFPPYGLHIIRCIEHQAVAVEIAERSITLVRDEGNTLPLKLKPDQRVAVIIPRTADLTPADSFFGTKLVLASALREIHPNVDEFTVPLAPEDADISTVLQQISGHDLVVCATLNAFETNGQIKLVRQVLKTGKPCVVVAMRLPYDLNAFPEAPTYLCTYGIQESSMRALARALMGLVPLTGHLPVSIPGLYPAGYARSKPWS